MSLEAKLALIVAGAALLAASIAVAVGAWLPLPWLAWIVSVALVLPLALWLLRRFMGPINRLIAALADGVSGFRDGDFSLSIAATRKDELGRLVALYNEVGELLRAERQNLYQRELLLDTVIQTSPLALVLTSAAGHVLYSNTAARQLFHGGRMMEGLQLDLLLEECPRSLRDAALAARDGLYTVEAAGEQEIYHVSRQRFLLNAREHQLLLFKQLTRELTRQELQTWKKVIRVISHELNNSLAPISSLAHSGRILAAQGDTRKLDEVFGTIEERASRLKTFLEGYARFAKLPQPRRERVEWAAFLQQLAQTAPFRLVGEPPVRPAHFDPAQMQQVLINLLKNARESGSAPDEIALEVTQQPQQVQLRVLDRGSGMSEAVLAGALLPFYSTKPEGSGLGLALCREIVEAHAGRLSLANREGGGLEVRVWLPALDSQA